MTLEKGRKIKMKQIIDKITYKIIHVDDKVINTITRPFQNLIRNFKDRKTHVYKKCSKCKTTLKLPLPKTRGINHAKCPECSNRVTLFTLRKQQPEKIKVEVIKKKK